MKTLIKIVAVVIAFTACSFSQARAQAPKKVKARITYSEKKDKDDKSKTIKKIDERQEFNASNQLIKAIEYDGDGKIKKYVVYTYEGGRKATESEYDKANKLKEKVVYQYNANGVLIGKTTYDAANKVIKKRLYSYEYF